WRTPGHPGRDSRRARDLERGRGADMGTPREIEPWQVFDSTWILRSGFMNIRRDWCRTVDGSRSREYLALDLKDFSVVVAVTPARELLLCREYKHGARGIMHTLPAGFIEPGETPEGGHVESSSKRRGTGRPRSRRWGPFCSCRTSPPPEATSFWP